MPIWIAVCAAAMLLTRVGLAFYTCGLVRAKNAGGSLLRHIADLCITTLVFWAVGIALYSPDQPCRWFSPNHLLGIHIGASAADIFLMLSGTLLASGVVVGSLSERSRFWPSLAPSILLALLVPALARLTSPSCWLGRLGFHDLGGASFIHLAGGLTALVGVIAVGPRTGKYNRDGSSNVIPGHNLPLAGAGMFLILIAWFPYLMGFAASSNVAAGMLPLNVILSVAAAGAASLGVAHFRYGKPDIYLTLSGVIGGLVAITAGADVMTNLDALITGAVAGLLVALLMMQEDLLWRIDDPTGALVIHGIGGAWGILATGLFATTSAGRMKFIGTQLMGLVIVAAVVLIAVSAVLFILKKTVHLRSREADEFDGLDLAEHDIGSYPDFQQTTIKSYHLREA